jgi:hypothetical protein
VPVWGKATEGSKEDVWDDTSKGRINEDELEKADEQASKANRRGGGVPGAGTKRGAKPVEEDKGMGELIFHVYRERDTLDQQRGGAGDTDDSNRQESDPGVAWRMGQPMDGTVLEYTDNLYPTGETGYRFFV